jgi:hypothetical protein
MSLYLRLSPPRAILDRRRGRPFVALTRPVPADPRADAKPTAGSEICGLQNTLRHRRFRTKVGRHLQATTVHMTAVEMLQRVADDAASGMPGVPLIKGIRDAIMAKTPFT